MKYDKVAKEWTGTNVPTEKDKYDPTLSKIYQYLALINSFGVRYPPEEFELKKFYEKSSHELNETVLSCKFRGDACDMKYFKTVSLISLVKKYLP